MWDLGSMAGFMVCDRWLKLACRKAVEHQPHAPTQIGARPMNGIDTALESQWHPAPAPGREKIIVIDRKTGESYC